MEYAENKAIRVDAERGQKINSDLLKEIIAFNIEDKKHMTKFWRQHYK